ncbi:Ada metal-binding domain-containing protein [Desulfobacter sp.]
MKKFIIGALVLLIGVPGFSFNFFNFLNFLAGLIPVLMILGGAIAVYLGIEELKQSDNESEPVLDKQDINPAPEPTEKTEATNTDETNEQPEPEIQQASESPATLTQQPAESLAPEVEAPEVETPADERVQFKGNIETLVFHSVTCNFASGKNCSMDFTTKEEAEAQGYKPCKICIPDA